MNEDFYQIYKSSRDLVEEFRHMELHSIAGEYLDAQDFNNQRLDKSNPDYYNRWRKEIFND